MSARCERHPRGEHEGDGAMLLHGVEHRERAADLFLEVGAGGLGKLLLVGAER